MREAGDSYLRELTRSDGFAVGLRRRWRNVKPSLATSVDAILPPYRLDATLSTSTQH